MYRALVKLHFITLDSFRHFLGSTDELNFLVRSGEISHLQNIQLQEDEVRNYSTR